MRVGLFVATIICAMMTALIFGEGRSRADSPPPAVLEIRQLYKEFLGFRKDAEFRVVGYGLCCKYHQWMLRVEKLRNEASPIVFIDQFGILPGELIALGQEYFRGRGEGEVAMQFENLIASAQRTVHSEPEIVSSILDAGKIGSWIYTPPHGTDSLKEKLKQQITIQREGGEYFLHVSYGDGSGGSRKLVEISANEGQEMRFRQGPDGGDEWYAILLDGGLAIHDSYGLIGIAVPQ